MIPFSSPALRITTLTLAWAGLAPRAMSQELDPRRWAHLPINTNFAGVGYAYATGEIALNPVLRIEDGEMDLHTTLFKYIRTFELLGKSARFDLIQAYQSGTWTGSLNGNAAEVVRNGPTDTIMRFAVNFYGAPPLETPGFIEYRKTHPCDTIFGAALAVHLPTGSYHDDKLINLGSNRFTIRPQIGMIHTRGKWTSELSSAVWFFTANDDFFNGQRLEEKPLFTAQGHLTYEFLPGLWVTTGVGFSTASESSINGVSSGDPKQNIGWSFGVGLPINRNLGVKLGYIGLRTLEDTGADVDVYSVALTAMW